MKIILNGKEIEVHAADRITYEQIIELAGYAPGRIVSVTFHKRIDSETEKQGILYPGKDAPLLDSMVVNAMVTGNA
jgi:hypothetical protein